MMATPTTPLILTRHHHHRLLARHTEEEEAAAATVLFSSPFSSSRGVFRWSYVLTVFGLTSLTIFTISALTTTTHHPISTPQLGMMDLLPRCIDRGTCASTDAPALKGFDPVAFFSGRLTPFRDCGLAGDPDINSTIAGYTFYFVTHDNRKAFIDDPETYWPMFGGFCAWGIAYESMWNASTLGPPAALDDRHYCTESWDVRFGKLYVLNRGVKELWLENPRQVHEDAQTRWSQDWYPGVPRLATPVNTHSYIHGLP